MIQSDESYHWWSLGKLRPTSVAWSSSEEVERRRWSCGGDRGADGQSCDPSMTLLFKLVLEVVVCVSTGATEHRSMDLSSPLSQTIQTQERSQTGRARRNQR